MNELIQVLLTIGQVASGVFGLLLVTVVSIMAFNTCSDKYKGRRRLDDVKRRLTLEEQAERNRQDQDQEWGGYINAIARARQEQGGFGFSYFEVAQGVLRYVDK